jgi:selenocysteine lyase/cysteine desulfurase
MPVSRQVRWPIDVQAIGCDFLSASMRKFLRGPRGAGFLYVSDRVLSAGLEPLYMDLHSASWTSNTSYTGQEDARRFELWERSYASHLGSAAAVRYALDVGMERLSARLCQLAATTRTKLAPIKGVTVLDKGAKLGGIVTIHLAGWKPLDLQRALQQQKINTSIVYHESARYDFDEKGIDWALRISPHYYNTEEEIETTAKSITRLSNP